jgi:hypothetical protein
MLDVIQATRIQVSDVFIVQGIKHLAAFFAGANQAHLAESAQLVRNGGVTEPYGLGEGANVFLALSQFRDNAYPAGIAKCAKEIR